MNNPAELIQSIGILPVLNVKNPAYAAPLAQVLCKTGIPAVELLFRNENALQVLKTMKEDHPEMAIGAGTILTMEQAKIAIDAGADFIVCPGYVQAIVDFCNEKGVLIVPGCTTAAEIQNAYVSGLRIVKFFPAEPLGGLSIIKQYAPAFPGMKFLPTNGIGLHNLGQYLKEDCIAACGGSFMAPASELNEGNFETIEALCSQAMDIALGFSLAHVGINAQCEEEAVQTAEALCALFRLPVINKGKSVFAGAAVEVMKQNGRGQKGHIGFRTLNVDRAVAYLKKKGVRFAMETAGYDDKGALKFVYLEDEIAGFALHLVK